jgi:hypothetical protein
MRGWMWRKKVSKKFGRNKKGVYLHPLSEEESTFFEKIGKQKRRNLRVSA